MARRNFRSVGSPRFAAISRPDARAAPPLSIASWMRYVYGRDEVRRNDRRLRPLSARFAADGRSEPRGSAFIRERAFAIESIFGRRPSSDARIVEPVVSTLSSPCSPMAPRERSRRFRAAERALKRDSGPASRCRRLSTSVRRAPSIYCFATSRRPASWPRRERARPRPRLCCGLRSRCGSVRARDGVSAAMRRWNAKRPPDWSRWRGTRPATDRSRNSSMSQAEEADFWYLGCIDATLWWLIALAWLDRHDARYRLRERLAAQRRARDRLARMPGAPALLPAAAERGERLGRHHAAVGLRPLHECALVSRQAAVRVGACGADASQLQPAVPSLLGVGARVSPRAAADPLRPQSRAPPRPVPELRELLFLWRRRRHVRQRARGACAASPTTRRRTGRCRG